MHDLYIVLSPAAVMAGFLGLIVLVAVVFIAGALAMRPDRPSPPSCESVECAETVELPSKDRRIVMAIPAPRRPVDGPTKVLPR
ncbi:hypothetical protein [Verrucosispora sp. NA02020]|uniref:hypothetical protein n=1 Tax=Verrucosispora sp. NA02020 TaxID=2742132 RepID=UPI0015920918|nr:hypothetical protein [Verrucosispora sp. NA02020]QKW15317.1 hypothetical protein HUT12_22860 [Verrucosispora sp. NA02020]